MKELDYQPPGGMNGPNLTLGLNGWDAVNVPFWTNQGFSILNPYFKGNSLHFPKNWIVI